MSDEEKWILSLWNAGLIRQRSNWIKGSGTTKQRNWRCVGPQESVSQLQQPLWSGVFFSVHICWKQAPAQTVKSDQHNFYCHLKTPLMLPKVILEALQHFRGLSSLPKAPGCVFSRLIIFYYLFSNSSMTQKHWRGHWYSRERNFSFFSFAFHREHSKWPFITGIELTPFYNFPWPQRSEPLLSYFKVLKNSLRLQTFFFKENRTGKHMTAFLHNDSAATWV